MTRPHLCDHLVWMDNAYTTEIRALLCTRCGAPITLPAAGNIFQCKYCGVSGTVEDRRAPEPPRAAPGPQEEYARLMKLRMQYQQGPTALAPYGFVPPQDVAYLAGLRPPHSLGPWFEAWKQAVALLQASGSPLDQMRVAWLARSVSAVYLGLVNSDPLRARAVLETALDLLRDPGHQHMMCCQLSGLASSVGDTESARRWLERCDPYSPWLSLDTVYRIAAAKIHLALQQWDGVILLIGREPREIPIDFPCEHMAGLYQVHAWEGLGQPAVADAQLGMWVADEAMRAPGTIAMILESHRWLQLCAAPLARRFGR